MKFAENNTLFISKSRMNKEEFLQVLEYQHARKLDYPCKASSLSISNDGQYLYADTEHGRYMLDFHIDSARDFTRTLLGPNTHQYRDKMWNESPELWAINMNYWLEKDPERVFLMRAFTDEPEGNSGSVRSFLSDTYGFYEHLDIVPAVMDIIGDVQGNQFAFSQISLSPRKFELRIIAKQFEVKGLRNYRGTGLREQSDKNVAAGIVVGNSEVGSGSFYVAPFTRILICPNGMTRMDIAWKRAHRGSKMETGLIDWSDRTRKATWKADILAAKDAVRTFLSEDFIGEEQRKLEDAINNKLTHARAFMMNIAAEQKYTAEKKNQLLDAFIAGGMTDSLFGVSQAFNLVGANSDDNEFQTESEILAASLIDGKFRSNKYDVPEEVFVLN